jgi:mannan endo-1,4-beta-mannosidase
MKSEVRMPKQTRYPNRVMIPCLISASLRVLCVSAIKLMFRQPARCLPPGGQECPRSTCFQPSGCGLLRSFVIRHFSFAAALLLLALPAAAFEHFVKVQGDQLTEGGAPFRFLSFNIPNLHLVEDNVSFEGQNPWRLPNRFEITDALATIKQMGGQVARTYVLSVRRTNDNPGVPRHVLGPGKFNEDAFRALDLVLQVANEQGVRVVIPFVDNWVWWGGIAEYAGFRGQPKAAFWTDPQLIADFKETIRFTVTRTNTLTGVRYADDKAILCWETGNEVESPAAWTREIAAYIKTLDPNHPVMDGYHTTELREESLSMPEVDIVTTHHYPGGKKSFAQLIRENAARAQGKKPYIVGEFGFVSTAEMKAAIEVVLATRTAGALAWSLRFRNRDGGFYWHSEPAGGNRYKAFHWSGSPLGDAYDEREFMALMRKHAFAIRGLPVPPLPVPEPPRLLPIDRAAAISWQGSVGASGYIVERSPASNGTWQVAAVGVDESFTQGRPQFTDEQNTSGHWYYRVVATNSAGSSQPSNIGGPVFVTHGTLVDELADFSKVHAQAGALEIKSRDCRQAQEDAHRAGGVAGSALVYRLPGDMQGFQVFVFYPKEMTDLKFSGSSDGRDFTPLPARKQAYYSRAGDYGYWKPVRFEAASVLPGTRFLRLDFTGEAQISRVEILHTPAPR